MNDVDIQDGAACGGVDVVYRHSGCAKYCHDASASSFVPFFGMLANLCKVTVCMFTYVIILHFMLI